MGSSRVQQNQGQIGRSGSVLGVRCFTTITWCHGLHESVRYNRSTLIITKISPNRLFNLSHDSYRCFGCQVLEGYGMTETSCVISCMDEGDTLSGHVGSPNPACGKTKCSKNDKFYKVAVLYSTIAFEYGSCCWLTFNFICICTGSHIQIQLLNIQSGISF